MPEHLQADKEQQAFLGGSLEDARIFPRGEEFEVGAVCFCGVQGEKKGEVMT